MERIGPTATLAGVGLVASGRPVPTTSSLENEGARESPSARIAKRSDAGRFLGLDQDVPAESQVPRGTYLNVVA